VNISNLYRRSLVIVLAAMVLLAGCSKDAAEKEPLVAVQAATAERAPIQEVVSAEAILFPLHQAAITPKVNAPVAKFYVNRGSRVHQGQLLAVLENRDLAAAEVENKGAFEQAQAEYQRTTTAGLPEEMQKAKLDAQAAKQALEAQEKLDASRADLFKQGALPRKELDQAGVDLTNARNQYEIAAKHLAALEAGGHAQQLKAAQGQLTSAQGKYLGAAAQLQYSEVRSPINGVVTDRPTYPGEMPPAGTPILTVMDTSEVIARAHIPQEQAARLQVGDPATITAPGLEGEVSGKVTVVSPALDPNSTTVEIWVQARNPHGDLKPGATVRVAMTARTVPEATVIPAAALLTQEGATSVMVVGDDGRAHKTDVEVGIRNAGEVQITKGLKPGQRVVTTGAYGLPDNTKVRLLAAEEKPGEKAGDGSKEP
jgi:multidrug efflux pump subunit AcrA (membrane-fusion protein)